jgi:hypothetical protein
MKKSRLNATVLNHFFIFFWVDLILQEDHGFTFMHFDFNYFSFNLPVNHLSGVAWVSTL